MRSQKGLCRCCAVEAKAAAPAAEAAAGSGSGRRRKGCAAAAMPAAVCMDGEKAALRRTARRGWFRPATFCRLLAFIFNFSASSGHVRAYGQQRTVAYSCLRCKRQQKNARCVRKSH
ncbi:hypothetical protein NPIL_612171 [Nephila pilipes]|uniref:Uncharacterized protein n=1 Tax=Nephila pilipes TaxID=299642 RepID=A0A8X6PW25_NEPPI|nr:hypothetical protein NPIL_612171 [Nephila pilipes]